jgi:hypothetical protein
MGCLKGHRRGWQRLLERLECRLAHSHAIFEDDMFHIGVAALVHDHNKLATAITISQDADMTRT